MHFHKVSRKQNDKRYEMIQAILSHLVKYDKTWYFRMLFVSKDKQSKIWKYDSVIDIYDGLMSIFFDRFGGHYPENFSIITLDEKNRPCWDDYIPSGIEKFLNNKVGERTKTVFTVKTANSAWNDLLQVSDIITAAIRQLFVPSNNKNKQKLAATLLQSSDRIKIWDGKDIAALSDFLVE